MKKNSKKVIFIDSDIFIALAKNDDSNHNKALAILNKYFNETIFTTSNYVISEVITVLSMQLGHNRAVDFINTIKSSDSMFSIQWVDDKIESLAIEIFKKQTSKNTSFTDCTNMAFIKMLGLDGIFSFDSVYRKNKCVILK
ncbi:PIN domain-containing protein [Patescibacteria group bacterium]|nr:PIN domain-containing protein [Patescibacteria group bacterium]